MLMKFDVFEQALPRESSIKQLKKLKSSAGKDIGDKTNKIAKKSKNSLRTDNPINRKVDTYEKFVKGGNKKGLGFK